MSGVGLPAAAAGEFRHDASFPQQVIGVEAGGSGAGMDRQDAYPAAHGQRRRIRAVCQRVFLIGVANAQAGIGLSVKVADKSVAVNVKAAGAAPSGELA